MNRIAFVAVLLLFLMAVGCGSYYIVKDPASGRTYYTTDVKQDRGGAVVLRDEKSGATVTLQSSEVKEVPKKEWEQGLKAAPPAK